MRGLRSLLVLVVVAVGLGAYVYFIESKRAPGEDETREKVFAVETADIEQLTVRASSGDETRLVKRDDAWDLVAPADADADDTAVSEITRNLASLEIQRVVEEQPTSDAEYGLAPPRIEVAFTAADGAEQRLQLGTLTPTGGDMYARVAGQERIFLVGASLDSSFDRTSFDLRDKSLLRFQRGEVDLLSIADGGGTIRLKKTGADWRLAEPIDARAEYAAAEGVVSRIESSGMSAIAAEGTDIDLKPYGLDRAETTVTIGAGSARATLAIGAATDDGKVFARDLSRPLVFTVDGSFADELNRTADEFRQRDLFGFRSFNATRIEVVRGDRTDGFEKVKGNEGDIWRRTAPTERDVDATRMDAMLSAFSSLRAESFADTTRGTGLNRPTVVVTARFGTSDDQQTETVSFGEAGDEFFAAPEGEPGAAKLDAAAVEAALKALDDIP